MTSQKDLYLFNRSQLRNPQLRAAPVELFERQWADDRLATVSFDDAPESLSQLQRRLAALVAEEQQVLPDSSRYVAEAMTRDEFRVLVQEFAVDGLTEAQVFYYVLPRLPLPAQMPLLRIIIDEFGSGNLQRAHTSLYINLLRELQMPVDLAFYCERIEPASFEFVNLFFWLALRAEDPSYFAGALTYLETVIPTFFECYMQGCRRLGIQAHAYYSEHQHIDVFHAIEGQRLLKAMHATNALDARKAWLGVRLASLITSHAFESAVAKAKQTGNN